MKKLSALLFSFLLLFTYGTSALASETNDVEKALELIETTNVAIDEEIEKTVQEANILQAKYFEDIASIQGSDAIVSLREQQSSLEAELLVAVEQEKIDTIKAELAKIDSDVASLESTLSGKSQYFADRTAQFHSELDQLIVDLDILTRKMTAETIEEAAALGVEAECVWKYVKIAHKWVWIDPIQVIGT
ncbi:hypothetical protein [Peribacillus alkalitolerans]|uniref:hypothetical protein n=1 Tax=Peribacillus alkalitolerans TaxID=1550385 RepID=UPI0013D87A62|nr:hypothetical protein [Peribacillus alkalitolerans]